MLRGTDQKKKREMSAFKSELIERFHKLTIHITTNKERHTEKEEAAISPIETKQATESL